MATNPKLIKQWIEYLKRNQIVDLKPDPNTDQLKYRRPATIDDVAHFLARDFTEEQINNAISIVLAKKNQGQQPPKLQNNPTQAPSAPSAQVPATPPQQQPQQKPQQPTQPNKKYNNDDAEDVGFRDVPAKQEPRQLGHNAPQEEPESNEPKQLGWKRKPHFKLRSKRDALREAFKNNAGEKVSEEEVEEIFNVISKNGGPKPGADEFDNQEQPQQQQPQQNPEEKKKHELQRIKEIIDNTMSDNQRKAFWNALHENINEAYANRTEVEEIFKDAVRKNAQSHLRKPKIDLSVLQKAWANAGYPSDTDKIGAILSAQGFDDKDIDNVFSRVLGPDYDEADDAEDIGYSDENGNERPVVSPAVQKIVDYIKSNGMQDEIIAYMEQKYGDELADKPAQEQPQQNQGFFSKAADIGKRMFRRKATTEDVRQIFTSILEKERTGRHRLIREMEQTQLGRTKK